VCVQRVFVNIKRRPLMVRWCDISVFITILV